MKIFCWNIPSTSKNQVFHIHFLNCKKASKFYFINFRESVDSTKFIIQIRITKIHYEIVNTFWELSHSRRYSASIHVPFKSILMIFSNAHFRACVILIICNTFVNPPLWKFIFSKSRLHPIVGAYLWNIWKSFSQVGWGY